MAKDNNGQISFLIWLILIQLCWILGTKVSEMLIDYIEILSFDEIQIAESLFSYTIAITILIWGYLVDRYNKKRRVILLASSFLWIIASFLLFFIPITFLSYSFIQILWGISFGASGPLLASYLGDIFKIEKRGKLFAIFTIFIYIIKGSNIAINGLLGESLGNWRAPTLIFGILGILILILFTLFSQEPQIALNEPEFQDLEGYKYQYQLKLSEIKTILKKKTNLLFLLQGISGMIGVVVVTKYMNYWFTSGQYDGLNINTLLAIVLLGAGGALGGLLGILFVGKWIDYQFKKGKIERILIFSIFCVFLQSLFYTILILGINYPNSVDESLSLYEIGTFLQLYPAFLGFILIFNICVFCGTPIGTTVGVARTHINLPEHRGTAGALYDLTDFIGSGIGITIGTALMGIFRSYQLTIVAGSLFWIISGFVWLFIIRFIRQDYEKSRKILRERSPLR